MRFDFDRVRKNVVKFARDNSVPLSVGALSATIVGAFLYAGLGKVAEAGNKQALHQSASTKAYSELGKSIYDLAEAVSKDCHSSQNVENVSDFLTQKKLRVLWAGTVDGRPVTRLAVGQDNRETYIIQQTSSTGGCVRFHSLDYNLNLGASRDFTRN